MNSKVRLSVMMFFQYAIWGAWLPLFYDFLTTHRGLTPAQAGNLFGIGAIGALLAPFVAGQIADRYFNTEKFLAISHILGGILVFQLAWVESYNGLIVFSLLYSLIYAPTIPLTNSIAFRNLPDRDADFGKVRVWGTVGWIVAGIAMGHWLLHMWTPEGAGPEAVKAAQAAGVADAFRLSAILGIVLGLFCFTLPKTPPLKSDVPFAFMEALRAVRRNPPVALFLIAFPISVIHQFYFVHTAKFLKSLDVGGTFFDAIFGVGGGGLMTIGQIAEIVVLAAMPLVAKKFTRKVLLSVGLAAYVLRFLVFAWLPYTWAVVPALALHGLCFGCFFFVAFMIVDEESPVDVKASAQSLFNFVVIGIGVIAGNFFAGFVAETVTTDGVTDYTMLFAIPMWIAVTSLLALLLFYPPGRSATADTAIAAREDAA